MKPYTQVEAEYDLVEAIHEGDEGTISSLAAIVDRLEPPRARASLLAAALWYAEQHIAVFPCQPLGKRPLTEHGLKDATTDAGQVERWWSRWPTANIGLTTGAKFDVIDFDGARGHAAWTEAFPRDKETWRPSYADDGYGGVVVLGTVSTPRPGGLHLYVKPSGSGNKAGLLDGVDYRGRGGYVVAPPSELDARPDQHPGSYRWLRKLALR